MDEMTEQYPHVLYYAPGSRANRANRAAAVRSAVHEMVACRLLPDPQAQTETCDMQTDDSAKQKTDGTHQHPRHMQRARCVLRGACCVLPCSCACVRAPS
eukprot:COSAG03_NODE_15077_length_441_cov_2.350877_2_plen_99_part_01